MNSYREQKTKAWLALLSTIVVLFLISTYNVFRDCYSIFIQVQAFMFSIDEFMEEREVSTSSRYAVEDVDDFLMYFGVCSPIFQWYTL